MKLRVSGFSAIRVSGRRLEFGAEFEASDADAERLMAAGYAEPAAEQPAEAPAEATDEPVEKPKRKGKGKA